MKLLKGCVLLLLMALVVESTAKSEPEDSQVTPIVRIAPVYPFKALLNGIEGWVQVQMTINELGTVDETEILDSSHPGLFDEAAIGAVERFKFLPRFSGGQAVKSKAAQVIEFDLPSENMDLGNPDLIDLMRSEIENIPPVRSRIIITDSVKIKSKIKPKKVVAVNFFFDDDQLQLNQDPIIWEAHKQNVDSIADFNGQLKYRILLAKKQYEKHPGLFKRFHRVYSAKNHPPELINTIDAGGSFDLSGIAAESYELTVNEHGKVTQWKSLDDKQKNKNPYIKEIIDKEMASLSFVPALKNGKRVSEKIKIKFKRKAINQFDVLAYAMKSNTHHLRDDPWVKVVALINEQGLVEHVKALDSSGASFESNAIKGFEPMKFSKRKKKWQMIQLIEFTPH